MSRSVYVIAFVAMVIGAGSAALFTWSYAGQLLLEEENDERLFATVPEAVYKDGTPSLELERAEPSAGMLSEEDALTGVGNGEDTLTLGEPPQLVRIVRADNPDLDQVEAWVFVLEAMRPVPGSGSGVPPAFELHFYDAYTGELLLMMPGPPVNETVEDR